MQELGDGGLDGFDLGVDAAGEIGAGGSFEGVGEVRISLEVVDGFGPLARFVGFGGMDDVAGFGDVVLVDAGDGFDGENGVNGVENLAAEGRDSRRVYFVEVEAGRLPIFMEGKVKIVRGGAVDPLFVGDGFGGAGIEVVAVHVDAVGGFARAGGPSAGIEERANGPGGFGKEEIVGEEAFDGGGSGGFVAVNSGGEVDSRGVGGTGFAEAEEGSAVDVSPMGGRKTAAAGELFEVVEPVRHRGLDFKVSGGDARGKAAGTGRRFPDGWKGAFCGE